MSVAPAPGTDSPAPVPARLPRRLAAIAYDSLLLAAVLFLAAALALGLAVLLLGDERVALHSPLRGNPLFSAYLLLVCFGFFGGFWVHGGQTLGMRAWRLRVRRLDGRNIGWWQALARFSVAGLWPLPVAICLYRALGLGAGPSLLAGVACLVLGLALRLPDRVSGTELVMLPKRGR
jgi:uncharacterized RDD family membrane protein YckC